VIIYKIVNKINGKIYIGQTSQSLNHRMGEHLSEAKTRGVRLIGRAFRKYGISSFDVSIIDTAESSDVLNEKEIYWTSYYNSKVPHGYNLTDGGKGQRGYRRSEETRRKLSASRKGVPTGRKGIPVHSEATKKRLSEMNSGPNNPRYGKPRSAETKEKLRLAHTGKVLSEEHKAKLSKAKKGKPGSRKGSHCSPETRKKISEALMGNVPWNAGTAKKPRNNMEV